ncbi:MAG: hypothetical protein ABIO71_03180 [Caldimonas sp.]
MQASDAFWHIANFFAPAVGLGGLAACSCRLLWRRSLAGFSVWRLWLWASGAAALASLVGLLAFQHDGRAVTYGAMVLACASALWWAGFRASRP